MSLALKYYIDKTPKYIFFDAVTVYSRAFQNSVTKHPLSDGSFISDHITSENQMISFSGVISDADLGGLATPSPFKEEGVNFDFRPKTVPTDDVTPFKPAQVKSEKGFVDFLPSSITQFMNNAPPDVIMATRVEYREKMIKDELIALRDSRALVSLIEFYYGEKMETPITNLVLTGLAFDENADSGSALFVAINLEQVRYVSLKKTSVDPKLIQNPSLSDAASKKDNKGTQGSLDEKKPLPESVNKVEERVKKEGRK